MEIDDPVRDFLSDRGCSSRTVEGGIVGLIEDWEKTVSSVETGYPLGLDDYLNDLDSRQLIEEVLPFVPEALLPGLADRLRLADERMRAAVDLQSNCLWSDTVAEMEGWTPEDNWWYYARPKDAAPQLLEEIDCAD